jgi:hypothetical protein
MVPENLARAVGGCGQPTINTIKGSPWSACPSTATWMVTAIKAHQSKRIMQVGKPGNLRLSLRDFLSNDPNADARRKATARTQPTQRMNGTWAS